MLILSFIPFLPELSFTTTEPVQLHSSRTEQEHNKATKTTGMVPIATSGKELVNKKYFHRSAFLEN